VNPRERCGQGFGGYVCDRDRNHAGDHRGYNEQIDAPLFWPNREQAMLDFFHWARLYVPAVPEETVRAMAHAIGQFISVEEAQKALLGAQSALAARVTPPQDAAPKAPED
jgi:hypothetical protein